MRFSICNELFEGWGIEEVFGTAAEMGYDGVEIAPFTLANSVEDITHSRRNEIARAATSNGIEIVGLHWLLVKPEGLHISHRDPAVRRRTRGYLDALIQFCADLGGRILIFGSPKQRSVCDGLVYEQAWEYARDTFAHCGETAGDAGVYLCIEALSTRETDFINTVTDALRMVRDVNRPNFRTMLDIKAISSEGRPLPEVIREVGTKAMHVHANDASGRGPGMGNTDFREIAGALEKIGYDGYVSVEVFDFKPGAVTIARDSLAHLKETFAE